MSNNPLMPLAGRIKYTEGESYETGSLGKKVKDVDTNKVDKVTGKGLSTEDFTGAFKTKLEGVSDNAKNVSVSASGSATDEVNYITIDGTEKKLAGGNKTSILSSWDTMPSNPKVGDRATNINDQAQSSIAMSAVTGLQSALNGKQSQNIQRTITIAVADWNSGTTCTKTVTGVTASNTVIVDPSDATVEATAQGTDSLTFTASATPSASVTVKVVILP